MRQNTFKETKQHKGRYSNSIIYQAFFYVSSFNFYSLFSLQILRFVYSLYLVFYYLSFLFRFIYLFIFSIRVIEKTHRKNRWANYWFLKADVTQFSYQKIINNFPSFPCYLLSNALCNSIFFIVNMVKVLNSSERITTYLNSC